MFAVVSFEGTSLTSTHRGAMATAKRIAKRTGISVKVTSPAGKWLVLPGAKAALKPWDVDPAMARARERDAHDERAYLLRCIEGWEITDRRFAARREAA